MGSNRDGAFDVQSDDELDECSIGDGAFDVQSDDELDECSIGDGASDVQSDDESGEDSVGDDASDVQSDDESGEELIRKRDSIDDGAFDVQSQSQMFEEKVARLDEMLTKLRPGWNNTNETFNKLIRERDSIVVWVTKRNSSCLRSRKVEKSWKKEIKREKEELRSVLDVILACREVEDTRMAGFGKLTF